MYRSRFILSVVILLISFTILFAQDPPETYDLRDINGDSYVPEIRNQGQYGTCWTFGASAAMEGNMLITGAWDLAGEVGETNLSERHLDWWNGFNQHNNDDMSPPTGNGLEVHNGGDYRVTSAYLTRGEGSIREIDAPYSGIDNPPARIEPGYHYYYPRNIEWYVSGPELENIDLIKNKIMEYGIMGTCMCYNSSFINNEYEHYQPPSDQTDPNHAVSIIGWDDNRETQAPLPGAWLVRNSWGPNWGNGGYFWISYYDKHATQEPEMGAISFYNVGPMQFENVYYHDYHGWRDTFSECQEAFNAFTAEGSEQIDAVSFFTAENGVDYEVKIYSTFSDGQLSGELISQSGSIEYTGFHTIDLETPIILTAGDEFYVYVNLSAGGHPYDRTSDVPVLLGASYRTIVESSSNPGESYYYDGESWQDFYNFDDPSGFQNTGNFCMKALSTISISGTNPPQNLTAEVINCNDIELTWEAPGRSLTGYMVYRNEELIAEISGAFLETYYLDEYLPEENYIYYVTAVYDEGVSNPSNTVEIDLVLPVPQNLNVVATDPNPNIILTWEPPVESRNLSGYKIYRNDEFLSDDDDTWFVDFNVPTGVYSYYVTAMYGEYESSGSNVEEVDHTSSDDPIQEVTYLLGNYPNPFNPTTTIKFMCNVPDAELELKIYNNKGQFIRSFDEFLNSGSGVYEILWDGKDQNSNPVSSGVYFYHLNTGSEIFSKKMVLLQ